MDHDDDFRLPPHLTENLSDIEVRVLRALIEFDGDPERVAADLRLAESAVLATKTASSTTSDRWSGWSEPVRGR